jgi:hypothetical protein
MTTTTTWIKFIEKYITEPVPGRFRASVSVQGAGGWTYRALDRTYGSLAEARSAVRTEVTVLRAAHPEAEVY